MSSKKEKYYDWYRAFVQMLMSRGVMTGMTCDWSVVIVTFVYSGNSKFVHNVLYALVPYFFITFGYMSLKNILLIGQDVYRGVKLICEKYKESRDFPSSLDVNNPSDVAEMIDLFMEESNKSLEKIQLQITRTNVAPITIQTFKFG